MKYRVLASLLALALATTALCACTKGNETTEASQNSSAEGTTEAGSSDSEKMNYSEGLDEHGYIDGVKAKELVDEIDFSKLTIKTKALKEESNEYVQYILDTLADSFAEEDHESEVKDGDQVNIDYSGSVDGEKFSGGTATNQKVTAGSKEFIDDFLTQIIGHKPGETIDVKVTFPNPYPNNTALSGKEAVFVTKINYIYEMPTIDDDFVKAHKDEIKAAMGEEFNSLEEMKTHNFNEYYEYKVEGAIGTALRDLAAAKSIPEAAVKFARNLLDISYRSNYNVSLDDLIKIYGQDEATIDNMINEEASYQLTLQSYYEAKGWTVTESELKELTLVDDNSKYIEEFGMGYLSRLVMQDRAMKEIAKLVSYSEE